MRSTEKIVFLLILVSITGYATAQQKAVDSLFAFREVARVRQLFTHLPVQIDIHIQNTADPVTSTRDTVQADMNLYYGKTDFYMQAEGLEEIVNDSFIVMINNPAKQILLYPNNQEVKRKMGSSVLMMLPDSSLQYLARTYRSSVQEEGGRKKIELKSRGMIFGTDLPKETLTLSYGPGSYEGAEFDQLKYQLLPVDSAIYAGMVKNKEYEGRLLSTPTNKGNLFFLVKRSTTSYMFKKIEYDIPDPPVRQEDRILQAQDGSFIPAKGIKEYILSKEF